MLRGGQARLLAVSSRAGLPEGVEPAPLLSEQWSDFVMEGFTGVFVPKGTPEERIRQLNRELGAILRDNDVRAAMHANAQEPVGGDPKVLGEQLRASIKRYREVIARLKLGAEN
jgi:tripartite-type tricarboxylate transporter receptor subunit TctC